jgi:hypothetical protein
MFSSRYLKKKWRKLTKGFLRRKVKRMALENQALRKEFDRVQARLRSLELSLGFHDDVPENRNDTPEALREVELRLQNIETKILAANLAMYANKTEREKNEAFQGVLVALGRNDTR